MKIEKYFKKLLFFLKTFLQLSVFRSKKQIFLFGSPYHPNMGDQAQTACIMDFVKREYPEYGLSIFRLLESQPRILRLLRTFIRKDDLIFCHSGYHLTNLYSEQTVYFRLIKLFPDKKIVIFPQTINYTTKTSLEEAKDILNNHPDLTIMCRDETSYETAKKNFFKAKLLLYPDIVTSLIGTKKINHERKGVLFCMRDDIEAFYKPDEINALKARFVGITIGHTDTTLKQYKTKMQELYNNRNTILDSIFEEYSHYKVIITDRYHGTIFGLISGTPVVVIGSTDHKLSSGVKWFPKEQFGDYITFANNLDEAYEKASEILNNYNKYDHNLPAYFKENYYDVLKGKLEGNETV